MKKFLIICLILFSTILPTFADKYDNPNYSRIEMMKGYEFAGKIKQTVKNKDIYSLANYVSYPIEIKTVCDAYGKNVKTTKITSKTQFINLYKNKLFTDKFVKDVCNEDLFANYRGFMLGRGEIWFGDEDTSGILKIFSINILN